MTIPATAVEFAADKGHPEHPLLHATRSPNSRVPCIDFSPWLRHQLEIADEASVIAYVLQIVEANPGVGFGITVEDHGGEADAIRVLRSGMLPTESPRWAERWIATTRAVLAAELDALAGMGTEAVLDLRTTLVMLTPLGSLDEFALIQAESDSAAWYLAAVMSPHEVSLVDPGFAMRRANEHIRRMQRDYPAWNAVRPVTPDDVTPPPVDRLPARLVARLPIGSRAHLANLAARANLRSPAAESAFGAFYATNRRGFDNESGMKTLRAAGLVEPVSDKEAIRHAVAQGLSKAHLQRLLDEAGIRYPKSATKGNLIALVESQARTQLDSLGHPEPILGLTEDGRTATDWVRGRVAATSRMWAAWLAAYPSERN